jgi:tRNA(fMet)-specific endonuclease VapC
VRYLLDTNIVSDLIRNPNGAVASRVGITGEASVCTSVVVAAELWYGALKRQSARLTTQVELILSALEIVPFGTPAERVYGQLRAQLERIGTPIGGNDLIIAAQTIALDFTLVTDNDREFARIAELRRENWLR